MPKLTIDIEARLAGFQDSLNKIVKNSEDAVSRISKSFSAIRFGVAGAAAVLAGKQIADAFQKAVDQAENFNKLAQRTGIAVESLSGFAVAAQLADVEQADLATGLKKLAVSMNEAASGSKEQVELFKTVGVAFSNANGSLRSTDDVLRDLADRFASFEDGPRKAALAVALFGKAGDALIPFLNNLRKMEDEAKKLGAVFGTDFARQAEEFNDNVKRMGIIAQGTGIQIAQFFLPRLNDIATEMVNATEKSGRFLAILDAIGKGLGFSKTEAEKLTDEVERLGKIEEQISRLNRGGNLGANPAVKRQLEGLIAERNEINKNFAARSRLNKLTADAAEELGGFTAPLPAPKVPDKKEAAKADPFIAFLKSLELDLAKAGEEGNKFTETFKRLDKEFGKRSEAERATALRLAAEIETRNHIAEVQKQTAADRAKEDEDAARRDEERKKRLQSIREEIEGSIVPITAFNKKIAEVSEALKTGLDPEVAEAFFQKMNRAFLEANEILGKTAESTVEVNDVARDLGLTFSSAFEDAIVEGRAFSDVLKGIEKDIIRILARKLVTEPLAGAITSVPWAKILAGLLPQAATGTDYVPQDMPMFLHKGEEVVPAPWTGRNGGGDVNININVDASGSTGDPAQSGRIMGAAISDAVRREIMTQKRAGGLLA